MKDYSRLRFILSDADARNLSDKQLIDIINTELCYDDWDIIRGQNTYQKAMNVKVLLNEIEP